MSIDLRSLRNFVAIASSGSISRAAESQHIAQPALSLQLKQLEERLGTGLFERHARGVSLTAAGERFLAHATDILRRMDAACEDVRSSAREPYGTVAIGMPQSVAKYLAVPLVRHVLTHWPKVRLQLIEMNSGYVPEELLRGRIDVGVMFGTQDDARLRYQHLLDEDLVLVAPPALAATLPRGARARKGTVTLEAVAALPIILPTQAHSLRLQIEEYLAHRGLTLRIIAEVNNIQTLADLARAGMGASILSYAAVREADESGQLAVLDIVEPRMHRPVYACQLATAPQTVAATKVQELLHRKAAELAATGAWPSSRRPPSTRRGRTAAS